MDNLQKGVCLLLKSAITGEKYALPENFDLTQAIKLAQSHQIESMIFQGAVNCGISSQTKEMQDLFMRACTLLAFNEKQMHVIGELCKAFDQHKIDYMPLKGIILKKIYPKAEMRSMSDADILIRMEQYDQIANIMSGFGFEFKYETEHELVWKKGNILIELHKQTMNNINVDYLKYCADGWQFAMPENGTRFKMSNEDFYIFMFVHLTKHYRVGGIGIKHIMDLWVYRNAVELDDNYIEEKLEILKLNEFHSNILETVGCWFEDGICNDKIRFITGVIFNSGSYGSAEMKFLANTVRTSAQKGEGWSFKKSRRHDITKTIFLPYENMCQKFPILNKVSILLPVFWIVRIFKVLFFKYNFAIDKMKLWKGSNIKKIKAYKKGLDFVGLDFRFEE